MILVSELAHLLLFVALAAWAGRTIAGNESGGRVGAFLGFVFGAGPAVFGGEWVPSFYTRAFLGEPGALSWGFLLHLLLRSTGGPVLLPARELRALALAAVTGALLIYPATLGISGAPDLYRSGFGGFALPTALLLLSAFHLWRGHFVAVAVVCSALFLYGSDLHESANLWDCLFDFASVVVSVVILMRWGLVLVRRLRRDDDGASLSPP